MTSCGGVEKYAEGYITSSGAGGNQENDPVGVLSKVRAELARLGWAEQGKPEEAGEGRSPAGGGEKSVGGKAGDPMEGDSWLGRIWCRDDAKHPHTPTSSVLASKGGLGGGETSRGWSWLLQPDTTLRITASVVLS